MSWNSRVSNHWRAGKNIIARNNDVMGIIPDSCPLIPPALDRYTLTTPSPLRDSFPSDASDITPEGIFGNANSLPKEA